MPNRLWNQALKRLARREYSRAELRTRLANDFPEQTEELESILLRLTEYGLQSDERYAELFLRSRLQRQQGPLRICQEATKKGIAVELERCLNETQPDWQAIANKLAQKKLATLSDLNAKTEARLGRFLAQRGFTYQQIHQAIEYLRDNRL